MFKNYLFSLFAALLLLPSVAVAQVWTIKTALAIEYAFEDVAADDIMGQQMLAKKRFFVYADDNYALIRAFSINPAPNTMDALVTEKITNSKSGETYMCMVIGQKKLRQLQTEENQKLLEIFAEYNDTLYTMTKAAVKPITIQGRTCQNWQLTGTEMTPLSLYITDATAPENILKHMPVFVQRDGKNYGLCLGNDSTLDKVYKFRAQSVEVDKPMDMAAHLKSFKISTKEEINKEIKKMMGF